MLRKPVPAYSVFVLDAHRLWCASSLNRRRLILPQISSEDCRNDQMQLGNRGLPLMSTGNKKGFWRAFLDFFILFSGISTASNLARTQGKPLLTRGLFLFRSNRSR